MEHIILHVYYHGEGETAERFVREMRERGLQQLVQREDGCMQYDYFLSFAEEHTVLLLEKWRDQAAFDGHLAGETMGKVRALKAELGLTTTLEKYE